MKRIRHQRLYTGLIGTSMLLLVSFTGYWLYKSYDEQRDMLRRETSQIFGSTIREIQDSLLRRNVLEQLEQNLPSDSAGLAGSLGRFRYERDVPRALFSQTDSMSMQRDTQGIRELQLFLRTNQQPPDSRHDQLRADDPERVRVIFRGLRGDNPFSIQVGEDSTQIDRIQPIFDQRLHEASLVSNYQIITREEAQEMEDHNFSILVPRYRRSKNDEYFYPYPFVAHFPEVRPYLFRQILPQILFCLVLLVLTGSAFALIYRSWLKQQRLAILKNDFISNMTHELKTPITTVGVALEAMSNFNALGNPAKTAEYLNISRNELSRLSILVDKVLKMSIFESREPLINPESLNMKQLCMEIIQTMGLHLEKQHAQIETDFQGADFSLEGDKIHLTNVVYNLLDNAIKYSDGAAQIELSMRAEDQKIILAVSDKGIGIPTQFQSRVFDKFFRVPTGDQHDRKGHGLGLSYVHSVIEKHKGSIQLNSREGHGTTFTIKLPKNQ
jgi:two-component system, OmpR family, phosphate regulon sensor histidine kinase PhoR